MKLKGIIATVTLLSAPYAFAWEVDNVTCRYQNLQDVQKQANEETNRRFQLALTQVNDGKDGEPSIEGFPSFPSSPMMPKKTQGRKISGGGSSGSGTSDTTPASAPDDAEMEARWKQEQAERLKKEKEELGYKTTPEGCDPYTMMKALEGNLASAHFGSMETWAMSAKISKCEVATNASVYKDFTLFESPVMRGGAGLNSVVQINGIKIGADKLSHFMTEGFQYYENQRKGKDLKGILQQGIQEEEGGYGLSATGIKSYADMNANYQGYLFWKQMLDGNDPFIKCEAGKWVQKRQFRWEDFVVPGMDESINCNTYSNEKMQSKVDASTQSIVAAKNPSQAAKTCPLDPQGCKDALNAIREPAAAAIVIHPNCRKAGERLMDSGTMVNGSKYEGVE